MTQERRFARRGLLVPARACTRRCVEVEQVRGQDVFDVLRQRVGDLRQGPFAPVGDSCAGDVVGALPGVALREAGDDGIDRGGGASGRWQGVHEAARGLSE